MNFASRFYAVCIHLLRHPRALPYPKPQGTAPRRRKPAKDRAHPMVVKFGRVEIGDRVKLVGGKGLR